MERIVFDSEYKVVTIDQKDVVKIRWINKHYEYHTLTSIYHGASNIKEEAELQSVLGFFKIDKDNIINMRFIDKFSGKGIFVNGTFYKLTRRKLAELKSQLRKYIPNSH